MNEITRIHIAKTAYDIEIAAKKQLEKYIKSLEVYTQDKEVIADIEIRITELLAERNVNAGGVITTDDVAAVRKQLGEPYEFADDDGDIAVGLQDEVKSRRLYRSTDDAVLGGVLSGVATYFNINPLWTRLAFVVLLFISFGLATVVYIVFWIITPAARTATQKLQLAGKDVTVNSIKDLNLDEEKAAPNQVAPLIQNILSIGFGSLSALASIMTLALTTWLTISALSMSESLLEMTNGFVGLGEGSAWLVWLLFWVVVFGLLLLSALFSLIAYAFFAKKLTKKMIITASVIVVLGISSAATVIGVSTTQSFRVANESRSMVRETKANLPKEFAGVTSLKFAVKEQKLDAGEGYFSTYVQMRYVVDEGPARYELSALPNAKVVINTEGTNATATVEIPRSFRNSFVQPSLTIYGPALQSVESSRGTISYDGTSQDGLAINSKLSAQIIVSGTYQSVTVEGRGSVDLGSSTVAALTVTSLQDLTVSAGTVRELTVNQPDVCPSGTYNENTSVSVAGVTSGMMTVNGTSVPAKSSQTTCAVITLGDDESEDYSY